MPYKRKDSPIYWASYTDPSGKRVRCSTGTTDRKEAVAIEAKWKLEAHQAKTWGREPERSIEEVMLAFLQATTGKRSHAGDLHIAKRWRALLPGRTIQSLKPADIHGYIAERKSTGVCSSTVNRELSFMGSCIAWCNRKLGWNLPNPVKDHRMQEPEGRTRWLNRDEAERLVSIAKAQTRAPWLSNVIVVALNTGMRRGEILGLEWDRVDLQSRRIRLEGRHTKAGKSRTVPMNDTARSALLNQARFRAEHCPASPWVFCDKSGKRIGRTTRSFNYACQKAGLMDFRFHDLRHTCAAWLVTAGVPLPEVRDLLGHSTVIMTERYAHLSPDNLRVAVGVLDRLSRSGHAASSEEGQGHAATA